MLLSWYVRARYVRACHRISEEAGQTTAEYALVILAAVEAGGWLNWLAVIAMLNAAMAAFYYLRVVVYMYMREPREEAPMAPMPAPLVVSLAAALIATIYLGVLPGRVLAYAAQSARDLVR